MSQAFLFLSNILYIIQKTDELVMLHDRKWYRHAANAGFAGDCVHSGDIVHCSDPSKDSRFNRNVDDAFNVTTRNILCYPVRANRGGGKIIGVLSMINKQNNEDFESSDYDIMGDCVRKISDELHIRFRELLNAAELLAGNSIYISDRSHKTGNVHHHTDATKASIAGQYQGTHLFFFPLYLSVNMPKCQYKHNKTTNERLASFVVLQMYIATWQMFSVENMNVYTMCCSHFLSLHSFQR